MSLPQEKLQEYLTFAHQLANASGLAILPWFRAPLAVQDKGGALFDPVTEGDKAAERVMRELIQARYPHDGILGEEEEAVAGSSGLTWVLDPIDGTRAFITGLPLWGTLIALNDGEQPVLGVMNQPFTRERYVGTRDAAWCNGAPLKTRRCASLSQATLMATTPDMFDQAQRAAFDRVASQTRLMRWGGDCYAYCMLASGYVDVIIEASLKPYDVQALMPIIEGAGGVMTSWTGGTAQHGGPVVACGDPALHAQVLELLAGKG
ncbi:histidinol-phosphatase [Pseudomonas sp. LJDD11]|uniref:histidinol-phosphatase n=1 Tax=unclassified Pseudomonas TaxID=196821 RepID=UPI0004F8143A|nr:MULTISPECIES: histidinol-phosphatase [unclassified Pseudomonas]MCQ9427331.1 histidinol-phosphatase [Pseudomonas sp. LJDD11]BAP45374.1 histidinol-phosphate phosphatase [Pseudomonas sp. StFLB209]